MEDTELFAVDENEATFHSHPTQLMFETFAKNNQQIEHLDMTFESGDYPSLDFSRIHLPNLQHLTLTCVNVHILQLTSENTPSITSVSLDNLTGEMALRLELPELVSFSAEHSFVGGEASRPNDFGLSISRCPKLETIHTYKFRGLQGKNYCILPSCESITLHRSECTDSLEILSAPKLRELNVRAAYGLENLRVWDFSAATMADCIKLNTGESAALAAAELARNTELLDWESGKKGDEEAVALGFVSKRGEWKASMDDGYGAEAIHEHAYNKVFQSIYKREMLLGPTQLVLDLMSKSDTYAKSCQNDGSLPSFELNTTNVNLSPSSQKHFTQHPRCGSVDNDEDGDAYGFGSGSDGYMAMMTGSTMGQTEYDLTDLIFACVGLVHKNVPLKNGQDDGMLNMVYSQEITGIDYGNVDMIETYIRMHDPDINMSFVVDRLLKKTYNLCLEEESKDGNCSSMTLLNLIVKLLEKYGFNVTAQDLNGNTVLHRLFELKADAPCQMWTNQEGRICNADWFMEGINLKVIRYVFDTCLGSNEAVNLANKSGETVMDMLNQRKERFVPFFEVMGTEESAERCKNEFDEMKLLLKVASEPVDDKKKKKRRRKK